MSLLSAAEVLQFAVKIEENGFVFYQKFADKLSGPGEKELFTFLADEEKKHIKIFSHMLDKTESFKPAVSYPDEYFDYLQAYADNLIFTEEGLEKEATGIKDSKTAVDFGIRRELDSIHYYQETKSFVPEKESNLIDNIIGEERKHFIKLSQMKKELSNSHCD